MKFLNKIQRFMYGRNGLDELNMFLFQVYLVLFILNIFIKSEHLPSIQNTGLYRDYILSFRMKHFIIIISVIGVIMTSLLHLENNKPSNPNNEIVVEYVQQANQTDLMKNIFAQLEAAVLNNKKTREGELVGIYFACDYYTLLFKDKNEIGGVDYLLKEKKDDYYKEVNEILANNQNTQEVSSYQVLDYKKSVKALKGLEDYSYFDLIIKLHFKEYNPIINSQSMTTTVTLIDKDHKFSVVALGE